MHVSVRQSFLIITVTLATTWEVDIDHFCTVSRLR